MLIQSKTVLFFFILFFFKQILTPSTLGPHIKDHFVEIKEKLKLEKTICQDCKDESENWICMKCHSIFCSRFVNGHFKSHYQSNKDHW